MIDWEIIRPIMGTRPDAEIAREIGVSRERVRQRRKKFGIPRCLAASIKLECNICKTEVTRRNRTKRVLCPKCQKDVNRIKQREAWDLLTDEEKSKRSQMGCNWAKNNRERLNAQRREKYNNDPTYKAKYRARQASWREKNPTKTKEYNDRQRTKGTQS